MYNCSNMGNPTIPPPGFVLPPSATALAATKCVFVNNPVNANMHQMASAETFQQIAKILNIAEQHTAAKTEALENVKPKLMVNESLYMNGVSRLQQNQNPILNLPQQNVSANGDFLPDYLTKSNDELAKQFATKRFTQKIYDTKPKIPFVYNTPVKDGTANGPYLPRTPPSYYNRTRDNVLIGSSSRREKLNRAQALIESVKASGVGQTPLPANFSSAIYRSHAQRNISSELSNTVRTKPEFHVVKKEDIVLVRSNGFGEKHSKQDTKAPSERVISERKKEQLRQTALEAMRLVEQRRTREEGLDSSFDSNTTPPDINELKSIDPSIIMCGAQQRTYVSTSPLKFTVDEKERIDREKNAKRERILAFLRGNTIGKEEPRANETKKPIKTTIEGNENNSVQLHPEVFFQQPFDPKEKFILENETADGAGLIPPESVNKYRANNIRQPVINNRTTFGDGWKMGNNSFNRHKRDNLSMNGLSNNAYTNGYNNYYMLNAPMKPLNLNIGNVYGKNYYINENGNGTGLQDYNGFGNAYKFPPRSRHIPGTPYHNGDNKENIIFPKKDLGTVNVVESIFKPNCNFIFNKPYGADGKKLPLISVLNAVSDSDGDRKLLKPSVDGKLQYTLTQLKLLNPAIPVAPITACTAENKNTVLAY